ncbi:MAG TPA: hypothetical protein ACFYD6_03745 [Candidatus Brocadiia bacterium]|nr:hypothetical protein [Candidatus Brocadiales bacterium]
MIKYIVGAIGCFSFLVSNVLYAETKEVTLKAGTVVLLAVDKNVTSKDASIGDIVQLKVIRPVKVDEIVVIKANTPATGKIAELKKAKGWGIKGEISMSINSTTAVDDTEVLLSAYQKREGGGNVGVATAVGVGTGVLCLPVAATGFLIKGKEGEIPLGYEIKAYTIEDVKLKVDLESS